MNIYCKLKILKAAVAIIKDPTKTDQVLQVGANKDLIDPKAFERAIEKIKSDEKSKALLEQRWNPEPFKLEELLKLPKDSFGFQYAKHMTDHNLDPEFYDNITGDDDISYIRRRVRQTHDFIHILTGFDTTPMGETGVISYTFAQMMGPFGLLLITLLLAHFAIYQDPRKSPDALEQAIRGYDMGKKAEHIFSVKLEECFEEPLVQLRERMNISPAAMI